MEHVDTAQVLREVIQKIATRPISEREMDAAVHSLLVTGGEGNRRTARKNMPSLFGADATKTKQQLAAVEKSAGELYAALLAMNAPAASVFRDARNLMSQVHTIKIIAALAEPPTVGDEIHEDWHTPEESLATTAGYVYFIATGKKPTLSNGEGRRARGPFIDFLGDVFAARKLEKASVENNAKKVAQTMEKRRAF